MTQQAFKLPCISACDGKIGARLARPFFWRARVRVNQMRNGQARAQHGAIDAVE